MVFGFSKYQYVFVIKSSDNLNLLKLSWNQELQTALSPWGIVTWYMAADCVFGA